MADIEAALPVSALTEYLAASMVHPFERGRHDCCTFAAGWVTAVTGLDPFERFRGLYANAVEANEIIARRGSLLEIASEEMERLGFERTAAPITGDVGLVMARAAGADGKPTVEMTAAIRSGERWFFRRASGLAGFPARASGIWRILKNA